MCLKMLKMNPMISGFKQIMHSLVSGQRVVIVRCEGINISGNFYRNKCKYFKTEKQTSCLVIISLNDLLV